jgi:hypothetical protein
VTLASKGICQKHSYAQKSTCQIIGMGLCGKKSERVVSRVLSSRLTGNGDHLSGPSSARRHERPTRKSRTGRPYSRSLGRCFPMWSCSRRGFPSIPGHPGIWWALTPPFHPYPCTGRSSFLWHCPWGRPLSRFGTALPCGARTFLPPLLGSDHLTRSDYERTSQTTIEKRGVGRKTNSRLLNPPFFSCSFSRGYRLQIFSSIALFARACASLFIARGMYSTSILQIFAISSLALACRGFRLSFFTL